MATNSEVATSSTENESSHDDATDTGNKERKGILKRIMHIFTFIGYLFHRTSDEDFEKRLQHLSKEEASTRIRLKRRSETWRKLARGLIVYSVALEIIFLGVAIIMTRPPELSWQMRAVRVLPMFVFPIIISLVYSGCGSYYRMCERKDQKTLERLQNERKASIDELKERTNYYLTQQLIHKYDSDPAAKEAAARVLASKLGADAGLAVSLEPPAHLDGNQGTSAGPGGSAGQRKSSSEPLGPTGLRRRSGPQIRPSVGQQNPGQLLNEAAQLGMVEANEQVIETEQIQGKITAGGGGWIARLAAMLVGEDPTQCYALICKNCHMHNGLARKEDFEYIAYHCPHCNMLNGSRRLGEGDASSSVATTPRAGATTPVPGPVQGLQKDENLIAGSMVAQRASVEAESSANYATASDNGSDVDS